MNSALDLVATSVGILIGVGAIIAGIVKWVIMPNLRESLIKPLENVQRQTADVHRQTTENHHSNVEPTLPDRLDDIQRDLKKFDGVIEAVIMLREEFARDRRRLRLLHRRLDEALERYHGETPTDLH